MRSLTLFCLLLVPGTLTGSPIEPEPGREVEFTVQPAGGSFTTRIFWPENFDSSTAHPVFFFYHGTGGSPTTRMIQSYTGKADWIVVGMPYALPANAISGESVAAELERIGRVLEEIAGAATIRNGWWIGGFSKGGWISALMVESRAPGLSGAAILGAGIPDDQLLRLGKVESLSPPSSPAVYIGIGDLDTNRVYSLRARERFHQRGLLVDLETYPGFAHTMPSPAALGFSQWLQLQRTTKASPELNQLSLEWWDRRIEKSQAISNPFRRLWYLEETTRLPFARLVPPEKHSAVAGLITSVRRHPSMAIHERARQAREVALKEEFRFRRSPELTEIARKMMQVHADYPDSWFGQQALLDAERVLANQNMLSGNRDRKVGPDRRTVEKLTLMAREWRSLDRVD